MLIFIQYNFDTISSLVVTSLNSASVLVIRLTSSAKYGLHNQYRCVIVLEADGLWYRSPGATIVLIQHCLWWYRASCCTCSMVGLFYWQNDVFKILYARLGNEHADMKFREISKFLSYKYKLKRAYVDSYTHLIVNPHQHKKKFQLHKANLHLLIIYFQIFIKLSSEM